MNEPKDTNESNYERIAQHLLKWANIKTVREASNELGISYGSLSSSVHQLNKRLVQMGGTRLSYRAAQGLERAVQILLSRIPNLNVPLVDATKGEPTDVEAEQLQTNE